MERESGISAGEPRTREDTLSHITEIKKAKTKKGKMELRKKYGVKEVENHFLEIPLDLNLLV